MFNSDKLVAKVLLSWKKIICQGFVIPHKMKNCTNCKKKIFYVMIVIK